MEKPRLRPIEVFPLTHEGKQMFHLHDPQGLGEEVMVSPPAFEIMAQFFNGDHSVLDIQEAILRATGSLIPSEHITRLIEALDEAGLLESEKFQARLDARRQEYAATPERTPTHAGAAYPDDPEQLKNYLAEILRSARHEGARGHDGVRAILAPHIDFMRGAIGYGYAYASLETRRPPETVIVLGTGHHVRDHAFVVTEKDFATPLGTVRTNRELVRRLADACGGSLLLDQYEHSVEHSVEFQAVFLKYVWGDGFDMVPVLCGAFPLPVAGGQLPREVPEISRFIETLGEIIASRGDSCFLVAGVDLAHVGPRFGGEAPVDQVLADAVEASDRGLLEEICRGDADGFYQRLAADENQYSVCGYGAIYTALRAVPGTRGTVLHYGQAVRPDGFEAVTFSAVALA
jgi:MEMO1 family protein